MKIELKILFLLVGVILLAQPMLLDAKVLKSGDTGYKDPLIALILSIILPGAGHFYLGQMSKGLIFLAAYIACWVVSAFLWWVFFLPLLIWIYAAFCAYNDAKKQNERGGRVSLRDIQAERTLNPVY